MDGSLWDRFWGIFGLGEELPDDAPDDEEPPVLEDDHRTLRPIDSPLETAERGHAGPKGAVISPRTKRWDFAGMAIFQSSPRTRDDAQQVANKLKARLPVLINLEKLDEGQIRRLVDFLSGVTYALDGNMKRVARGVYLCSPSDIPIEELELSSRQGETLFDYEVTQAVNE